MKKILLVGLLFAFIFAGHSYAAQKYVVESNATSQTVKTTKKANFFHKALTNINEKVHQLKQKVSDEISQIKSSLGGKLQTAIVLMIIGLIFLILAGAIGGSIVWAVGAIFFVIGALLLLLYFM
jgi:Flp pilus assembly protein TadB